MPVATCPGSPPLCIGQRRGWNHRNMKNSLEQLQRQGPCFTVYEHGKSIDAPAEKGKQAQQV